MNKLERLKREAQMSGLVLEVYPAPSYAVTFDTMAVLRRPTGTKFIVNVVFYDSRSDQIVQRI
jgi:hypothetical protein